MASVCVIRVIRTVKVWITFCGSAQLIQNTVHYIYSTSKDLRERV